MLILEFYSGVKRNTKIIIKRNRLFAYKLSEVLILTKIREKISKKSSN